MRVGPLSATKLTSAEKKKLAELRMDKRRRAGNEILKRAVAYFSWENFFPKPRTCMQVVIDREGGRKPLVATFGGIPLKRQKIAVLNDRKLPWAGPAARS